MAPVVRASGGRRLAPLVPVALLLALAGCGGGDDAPSTSAATSSAPSAGASDSPSASESASPTGSARNRQGTGGLPGQMFEGGPRNGQLLAVLGVASGETLAVQSLPGPVAPGAATVKGPRKLAALSPVATQIRATGRSRLVDGPAPSATAPGSPGSTGSPGSPGSPGSTGSTGSATPKASATAASTQTLWSEVTVNGVTGWVDASHLATPAAPADVSDKVAERLGGKPVKETMLDLGQAVAQVYATAPSSAVTVTVAPAVGDRGEITVDVAGLGDDSVAGQRLHIVATPGEESFTLDSVEATAFCYRGVSGDRCV